MKSRRSHPAPVDLLVGCLWYYSPSPSPVGDTRRYKRETVRDPAQRIKAGCTEGSRAEMRREGVRKILLRVTITLREANVVADAIKEYTANHDELHPLYRFRLGELEKEIRSGYILGKQREAEKERLRG